MILSEMVKTQRKQIRYEAALDMISGLNGILTRIKYWNKSTQNLDDPTINAIKIRIRELYKESDCSKFDRDNILVVDEILKTYGNLNKRFSELYAEKVKKYGMENVNDSMCYFDDLVLKKVEYER